MDNGTGDTFVLVVDAERRSLMQHWHRVAASTSRRVVLSLGSCKDRARLSDENGKTDCRRKRLERLRFDIFRQDGFLESRGVISRFPVAYKARTIAGV